MCLIPDIVGADVYFAWPFQPSAAVPDLDFGKLFRVSEWREAPPFSIVSRIETTDTSPSFQVISIEESGSALALRMTANIP
jgi:hypothetical protein